MLTRYLQHLNLTMNTSTVFMKFSAKCYMLSHLIMDIANTIYPDQTASLGAVWSGFIVFASKEKHSVVHMSICSRCNKQTTVSGQKILTGWGLTLFSPAVQKWDIHKQFAAWWVVTNCQISSNIRICTACHIEKHFKQKIIWPEWGLNSVQMTNNQSELLRFRVPVIQGLQSLPPSPKRAERKGRRRPFREAGSGHKQWNTVSCVDTFSIISKFSAHNSKI